MIRNVVIVTVQNMNNKVKIVNNVKSLKCKGIKWYFFDKKLEGETQISITFYFELLSLSPFTSICLTLPPCKKKLRGEKFKKIKSRGRCYYNRPHLSPIKSQIGGGPTCRVCNFGYFPFFISF